MKSINELTNEECQEFLNSFINLKDKGESINNLKDTKIEIQDVIIDENNNRGIIKYKLNEEFESTISICNPYFIEWLYKNDIDISIPLNQLKIEYEELDETNSILFEYAMDVSKIMRETIQINQGHLDVNKVKQIEKMQKELINKI